MGSDAGQRSSIFTGLLLILLGALFLLQRFHPHFGIGHLLARYWPVLLILWGFAKLVDHLTSQRTGEGRPAILTGPEAATMLIVIAVLIGMSIREWIPGLLSGKSEGEVDVTFLSETYSDSQELPARTIPAGAHVLIQTIRGNITIHAGEASELRVSATETASGSNETAARERLRNVKISIDESRNGYTIHPASESDADSRVRVDLDVQLPKQSAVSAKSTHGDITISGVAGAVSAEATNGDIEIHDTGSDTAVKLQKGDARISNVAGNVSVSGKGNEVEVDDVRGNATFDGDFFGAVHVRNVAGTTHYTSHRSDLTVVKLDGRLELDSSGNLQVSDVAGSARLITHNNDIEVENVAGALDIRDAHGDIKVGFEQPPRAAISIRNETGDVELTLPSHSVFDISAMSQSGDVDSEFSSSALEHASENGTGRIIGRIGSGGPKISIATTYGTISLKKSS